MNSWARMVGRIARRPLPIAIVALLVALLSLGGLLRLSLDSGRSMLVGSESADAQTYAKFTGTFGGEPIVVVFAAQNASAPYLEQNLRRLGALELDLAHDPRVASVLGPGTVAASLTAAAVAEVSKVIAEYPYFVAETDYLGQLAKGATAADLTKRVQDDITSAQAVLEVDLATATRDAILARADYKSASGDHIIASQEHAVDAAVAKDTVPPLWAEYLAGPKGTPDEASAQLAFDRLAAAYGACDTTIAGLLNIPADCQSFFERALLDLPHCPVVGSTGLFCAPKPQWASVLPAPQSGGLTYMVLAVRLKQQYGSDRGQVTSLRDAITTELNHGIRNDAYTRSLSAASVQSLHSLGRLRPTECAGESSQQNSACLTAFKDAPMAMTIAGGPLLDASAAASVGWLLVVLLASLVVMALVLLVLRRGRGRVAALMAALATTAAAFGMALLLGLRVTPALVAGIDIVSVLSLANALHLVSEFGARRATAADTETAVGEALSGSGAGNLPALMALLIAALILLLFTGIDAGPLVAQPLAAQLAMVAGIGMVLTWAAGVFIALPLAAWSDRRSHADRADSAGRRGSRSAPPAAGRTIAIADSWRGVVAPLLVLALAGLALLRGVPAQADPQQLVNPGETELSMIHTAQAAAGISDEIDIYLRGKVATGSFDARTGLPTNVEWQCQAAQDILSGHTGAVTQALSVADAFIGSGTVAAQSSAAPSCTPASKGSSLRPPAAVPLAATSSASPTSSPSPAGSPGASPSPSPSPGATAPVTQTLFLCDLRLLPLLSRSFVMDIPPDTTPCPAVDEYQQRFLGTDSGAIDPRSARIVLGIQPAPAADLATLIASLRGEMAGAPGGLVARPTGALVLSAAARDALQARGYLWVVVPPLLVALGVLALSRRPRRLLAVLPGALAAAWTPLVLLLLGRLPAGDTLGALTPLTAAVPALMAGLGTLLGALLLTRFEAAVDGGQTPEGAAADALETAGPAVRWAGGLTCAGLGLLALSGLFPVGVPYLVGFGLVALLGVALAVAAVFTLMLPVAVVLARRSPGGTPAAAVSRRPGVSGRRRSAA